MEFHEHPQVLHFGQPGTGVTIQENMIFTIEPMITIGSPSANLWEDGWTAATNDLSRTAQFEHTILVRDDGVEILTLEDDEPQPFLTSGDGATWPQTIPTGSQNS